MVNYAMAWTLEECQDWAFVFARRAPCREEMQWFVDDFESRFTRGDRRRIDRWLMEGRRPFPNSEIEARWQEMLQAHRDHIEEVKN